MLLLLLVALPAAHAATELYRTTAPATLRAVSSSSGDGPVPIVVYDGESVEQVVRRTVAAHDLPDSSLEPLRSLVTERTLQGFGDTALRRPLCRVPVALTVPSQISTNGDEIQRGVMLTIYEDTNPAALAEQLTARYLLPVNETVKLREYIEDMMLQRLRLRVAVRVGGDEQRSLVVRKGETAAEAAVRFGAKFGLTEDATKRLTTHILQNLPGPDLVLIGDEWRA